jgi:hypothetical protein
LNIRGILFFSKLKVETLKHNLRENLKKNNTPLENGGSPEEI